MYCLTPEFKSSTGNQLKDQCHTWLKCHPIPAELAKIQAMCGPGSKLRSKKMKDLPENSGPKGDCNQSDALLSQVVKLNSDYSHSDAWLSQIFCQPRVSVDVKIQDGWNDSPSMLA